MPIWMPSDTQALLGTDARECKSRSLFMDRFAHLELRKMNGNAGLMG